MAEQTGPKAQVAAVLDMHAPREYPEERHTVCAECRQTYPCPTVRAIDAAECAQCHGDGWIVDADHAPDCGGDCERHGCPVQFQAPCPGCTTLAEREPVPVADAEDPF